MMMLGGVPIMVTRPPRIEPNDSGISTTAGDFFAFCAACIATGMRSASAPTLFMIVDRPAPTPESAPTRSERRLPSSVTCLAIRSIAPEFDSAREMISTIATVTVAGWPKPLKAPA